MSNESKTKMSEMREWLSFIFNFGGFAGIAVIGLVLTNQKLQIQKEADAKYETIQAHETDKSALISADGKLADAETKLADQQSSLTQEVTKNKADTDLKIQHLTDIVVTRRDEYGKPNTAN